MRGCDGGVRGCNRGARKGLEMLTMKHFTRTRTGCKVDCILQISGSERTSYYLILATGEAKMCSQNNSSLCYNRKVELELVDEWNETS